MCTTHQFFLPNSLTVSVSVRERHQQTNKNTNSEDPQTPKTPIKVRQRRRSEEEYIDLRVVEVTMKIWETSYIVSNTSFRTSKEGLFPGDGRPQQWVQQCVVEESTEDKNLSTYERLCFIP